MQAKMGASSPRFSATLMADKTSGVRCQKAQIFQYPSGADVAKQRDPASALGHPATFNQLRGQCHVSSSLATHVYRATGPLIRSFLHHPIGRQWLRSGPCQASANCPKERTHQSAFVNGTTWGLKAARIIRGLSVVNGLAIRVMHEPRRPHSRGEGSRDANPSVQERPLLVCGSDRNSSAAALSPSPCESKADPGRWGLGQGGEAPLRTSHFHSPLLKVCALKSPLWMN